jgi:hypothetical protein
LWTLPLASTGVFVDIEPIPSVVAAGDPSGWESVVWIDRMRVVFRRSDRRSTVAAHVFGGEFAYFAE